MDVIGKYFWNTLGVIVLSNFLLGSFLEAASPRRGHGKGIYGVRWSISQERHRLDGRKKGRKRSISAPGTPRRPIADRPFKSASGTPLLRRNVSGLPIFNEEDDVFPLPPSGAGASQSAGSSLPPSPGAGASQPSGSSLPSSGAGASQPSGSSLPSSGAGASRPAGSLLPSSGAGASQPSGS
ncbi:MAG: hypothetical protein LBF34_00450 [Puniceicoccales bacterium]|nr:hypothetical protein [Puniceicoccales bacterium]